MAKEIRVLNPFLKIAIGVLLGIFMVVLTSCDNSSFDLSSENKASYQKIAPLEAREILKSKEVTLVDVRTEEEYIEKHIPGSILIPVNVLKEQAPIQIEEENQSIVVYCKSGVRSAKAAQTLVNLGYTDVYDLGGIADWPYETEEGKNLQ